MFSQLNMERHFVSCLAAWFVLRHSPVACPRKSDFDVLSAKFDLSEIVLLAIQGYTFVITCDSCDSELRVSRSTLEIWNPRNLSSLDDGACIKT